MAKKCDLCDEIAFGQDELCHKCKLDWALKHVHEVQLSPVVPVRTKHSEWPLNVGETSQMYGY